MIDINVKMAEFMVESSPKKSIFAITLDLWKIGEKFQRLPSTYLARCVGHAENLG